MLELNIIIITTINNFIVIHTYLILANIIKANAPVLAAPIASFYQIFCAKHAPNIPPPITAASNYPTLLFKSSLRTNFVNVVANKVDTVVDKTASAAVT